MNETQIATAAARIANFMQYARGQHVILIEGAALNERGAQVIHRYGRIAGKASELRSITAEQIKAAIEQPATKYGDTVGVKIYAGKHAAGYDKANYRV
jgi:hypothetical protein